MMHKHNDTIIDTVNKKYVKHHDVDMEKQK